MKKARIHNSKIISDLLKSVDLETRLRNRFELRWLAENTDNNQYGIDENFAKAYEYGKRMTKIAMEEFDEWEKDGRPKPEPNEKKS